MDDTQITLEKLKKDVQVFCEQRDWDKVHTAKDLSIGLSLEAGELMELFRYKNEAQVLKVLELEKEAICDELADCLFVLLRFAQKFDFDLSQSFASKLKKTARKYPIV